MEGIKMSSNNDKENKSNIKNKNIAEIVNSGNSKNKINVYSNSKSDVKSSVKAEAEQEQEQEQEQEIDF
jgi:hypothetical protein